METKSKKSHSHKQKRDIAWDANLMSTGFPEIDVQHKEWIARFNTFVNAARDGKGQEIWGDALLFYIRYTETHFAFEESLMKKYHCPSETLNKEAHDSFKDRIHEIANMTWPSGATDQDLEILAKELRDWLIQHICSIDVVLREVAQET